MNIEFLVKKIFNVKKAIIKGRDHIEGRLYRIINSRNSLFQFRVNFKLFPTFKLILFTFTLILKLSWKLTSEIYSFASDYSFKVKKGLKGLKLNFLRIFLLWLSS